MGRVSLALGVFAAGVFGLYAGQRLHEEMQERKTPDKGTNASSSRRPKKGAGLSGLAGTLASRLGLNAKDFASRQVKGWLDDGKDALKRRFSRDSSEGGSEDDDRNRR